MIESHDENQADASAVATRFIGAHGQGHFTQYGRVEATAEIDVVASGFGPAKNALWRAKAVEYTFSKRDGFQTVIEVEAPETRRSN